MSEISFGRRSYRGFQKFYDGFHVAACVICVILLFAGWLNTENHMKYFPLIFLDAAALNFVRAYARMQASYRRRHQKTSGLGFLVLGLVLLLLAYIVAVCVW